MKGDNLGLQYCYLIIAWQSIVEHTQKGTFSHTFKSFLSLLSCPGDFDVWANNINSAQWVWDWNMKCWLQDSSYWGKISWMQDLCTYRNWFVSKGTQKKDLSLSIPKAIQREKIKRKHPTFQAIYIKCILFSLVHLLSDLRIRGERESRCQLISQ